MVVQLAPSIHQRLLHQLDAQHEYESPHDHHRDESNYHWADEKNAPSSSRKDYSRQTIVTPTVNKQQTIGIYKIILGRQISECASICRAKKKAKPTCMLPANPDSALVTP